MRVDAVVTQGRSLTWPIGVAGVSAAILVLAMLDPHTSTGSLFAVLTVITLLSLFVLSRTTRHLPNERRRVGADARGLSIDGELVLPRQAIQRTRVRDEPDGSHSVIVEARGFTPSRIVHVESSRIAQALADTLDQTPLEVTEFEALPPWAHQMRWLAVILTTSPWLFFNLVRYMPSWSFAVVLSLYGVIALPIVLPQKVAIGEDGILLRWAGRRRFIPFSLLRDARSTPLGLKLDLADERTVEIRLTHRDGTEVSRRAAMLSRIEEGLAHHRALAPAEDEALLTRGERELDKWIHEMTVLGTSDAYGYRTIAIPRDRLWAVLENPSADPSARQGAAIALRARLDDDERERLAAIGQKSASPHLRVAIDAVARAPDAPHLRIALEASEEDEDCLEEHPAKVRARAHE